MHVQKWIVAAVLTTLAAGGSAHAAETGLAIPRLAAPPTIDGRLAPGEWDGACG